jgi:bacterioferritin-associated ferredoxin
MIVCSCNAFSDHQVRSVVAKEARRPRMSEVYACLGCSAQCGRCAHTSSGSWMKGRPAHRAPFMRTQACINMELIQSRTA